MKKTYAGASFIVLALVTPFGGAALAQTPAKPEAAKAAAEEIIVTAQKRNENLQDVPIAMSVVSGNAISPSAANIENLINMVPTLTFNKGGTTLNSSLFLRGVGTINFSIAAEPSVAYVLDGVVYARSGEAFGDLYDLERIEVLRGPQGTLFGKNASAGVINVVSRKPGKEFGGKVELSAFEDQEYKGKIAVDLPISDTLRTRITGFTGSFGGYLKNTLNGEKLNGYNRYGVRAVTVWEAAPNLDFTIIGDYRRSDDKCCIEVVGSAPTAAPLAQAPGLAGVQFLRDETRTVRSDTPTQTKETSWGVSAQADYRLENGFTLTSLTAYRGWDNTELREGDWTSRRAPYVGGAFARVNDSGPQESTTFSQEVRLASPDDQKLTYVIGAYFYAADADRTFRRNVLQCLSAAPGAVADATGLVPCGAGANIIDTFSQSSFGSEFRNTALFGQAQYAVTDKLDLIGGLRFTHDEVKFYHNRIPAPLAGLSGILNVGSGFRGDTSNDNWSGKAGLAYKLSDTVNSYVTYTRGYKGPAFNVFFNQNATQTNVIEPETADAYEAGLKTTWLDGRVLLNAAVFTAEYQNFQANSPDLLNGAPITRLTNAGTVSTSGVELDWIVRPTQNFSITGGLAYTDAQIEEFRVPGGALSSARKGESIPFAPEWKGTIAADWRIEPTALPFNTRLNASYSYTGDQLSSLSATAPNPVPVIDAYGIIDASVTFSDKEDRLAVSLIGKNLSDESFASLIATGGPGGAVLYRIPREADRYFGVSFRANF
jgi:iron complex outermembrane receptor protein